ncbi:putative cfem domain-containing protein [Phaeomoniella chlamydospora]|uniref:Putative cfem domain-containing protein n=1 Tax=Phaeomoniella chlamydospora TaxID=158046 RepID=A0A0G2EU35_PHACM|nr:putative cfem domain-containing protein [Phaeomoniella chlamydospora]
MPMKYLWALAVDTRKRVGIILLFSSGLITVIASILRLRTIYKFYNSKDLTYNAYPIAIWSAVEINLTIATASVAASKPFMDKIIMKRLKKRWPNMFTLTTASESSSGRSLQSTSKVMISHNARGSSIIPDPPPSSGMSTTIPEIHTPSTLHSVPPEDKDSHSNAGFNWNNKNNHGVEDVATTTAADDDDDDDMEFDDYNNTLRAISSPAGASSTRGSQSRQRNGQMTMTEILKESRMPSTENIHKMSSRTTNDNVFWLKGDGSLKADKGDRETG